jgi:hypothetical protein
MQASISVSLPTGKPAMASIAPDPAPSFSIYFQANKINRLQIIPDVKHLK